MRQRSTCTRVLGREEYGEGKEMLMIQSIPPHHQWSMVVLVSWCGHHVCQWNWFPCIYWWCECWQKQQDEFWSVSGNIICSYPAICSRTHWTALIQCRCTMTRSILRKQPKKWNVMQWPSQSPDLNPIEHAFLLLKTKLKGKCPKNKQELKTVAVVGLVEHHQGWNPASGVVYAFQTSGCNWLQRICNQALKSESLIYDC